MYKAVVFDFDGTIIDTEKHLYDIINKHLSFHGGEACFTGVLSKPYRRTRSRFT